MNTRLALVFFAVWILVPVVQADEPYQIRCDTQKNETIRLVNRLGIWRGPLGRYFQISKNSSVLKPSGYRAIVQSRGNDLNIQVNQLDGEPKLSYKFKGLYDDEPVLEVLAGGKTVSESKCRKY